MPDPMFVYVMSAGQRLCKIGIAKDLDRRRSGIQTGNPKKVIVRYAVKVPSIAWARHLETLAHKKLRDQRAEGEWFHTSYSAAVAALREVVEWAIREPETEAEADVQDMAHLVLSQ